MKILFTGGGTAGHITPALAAAGYIKEHEKDAEIRFAGAKGGIDEKIVTNAGYKLYTYEIKGFERSLSPKGVVTNLMRVKNIFSSVKQAKKDLTLWRPDVIVGTGGYASFPMVYAGAKMGIRTSMLEVNAYPGVAVKYLADRVDSVMISFEDTAHLIPKAKKTVFTGSPVRDEIIHADGSAVKKKEFGDDKPLLLTFWGSVGAQYMNEKMCDFIKLCSDEKLFNLIHVTGAAAAKWMPDMLSQKGVDIKKTKNVKLYEYIYDMGEKMAAADLVMCRAGASSLAEVCCQAKPSVIVPSPYVTDNHQEKNARVLEKNGAAKVILEKSTDGKEMYETVKKLIFDGAALSEMSKNAAKMAVTDGTDKIYKEILRLISLG